MRPIRRLVSIALLSGVPSAWGAVPEPVRELEALFVDPTPSMSLSEAWDRGIPSLRQDVQAPNGPVRQVEEVEAVPRVPAEQKPGVVEHAAGVGRGPPGVREDLSLQAAELSRVTTSLGGDWPSSHRDRVIARIGS